MTPDELKAEFNSRIDIIRSGLGPVVEAEITRFQKSGLFPNELNIDTFSGAIDDEKTSDDVRRFLRFAADFKPN
jgi:hypothetical protein